MLRIAKKKIADEVTFHYHISLFSFQKENETKEKEKNKTGVGEWEKPQNVSAEKGGMPLLCLGKIALETMREVETERQAVLPR